MTQERNLVDVSKLTFEQLGNIRKHLAALIKQGGSDLHVKANSVIRMRDENGNIKQFSGKILSKENALIFAKELLKGDFAEFVEQKEMDLVYPYDERNRFRVNIFFQMEGVSAVFRLIPVDIPTFEQFNLPEVLRTFTTKKNGLVLVTGATGSGKSTTLASIIDEINRTQQKHIITIEEPVEFVHKDRKCLINHRSVGRDTLSFSNALRAALREDPDIILVGEIRDAQSVQLALHAADTGHLVFSTLHSIDAKDTVNRLVAMFPTNEQNRIRSALSGVLQGIVSQRLVPAKSGRGKVAAMEILVRTSQITKLIKENRDEEIKDAIEKGRDHYKSQSFDQSILDLYIAGKISRDEAKKSATSSADMELRMSGIGSGKLADGGGNKGASGIGTEKKDDIFELK